MRTTTLVPVTLVALTPALLSSASDESRLPPHRYTTYPNTSAAPVQPGLPEAPDQVAKNRLIIHKGGAQSETTIAVDKLPAGYEAERAKSDLEFFRWKRDFLGRLPAPAKDPKAQKESDKR